MKALVRVAAIALLTACAGRGASSSSESELRAAILAYRTALNGGDSASFFAFLAPDIEVLPPGAMPVRGTAARDLFRPLFTQVKTDLAPLTDEELTVSGNVAVHRYTFQLTTTPMSGGAATTEGGSGLHVWHLMPDGRWQIVKDIWTTPPTS